MANVLSSTLNRALSASGTALPLSKSGSQTTLLPVFLIIFPELDLRLFAGFTIATTSRRHLKAASIMGLQEAEAGQRATERNLPQ